MKARKWLMQDRDTTDLDYVDYILIEELLEQDVHMGGGNIEYTENAKEYDGSFLPVGDFAFTEAWLWENFRKRMAPLEVPEILQTPQFLGRSYRLMDRDMLPSYEGGSLRYFVKNVDKFNTFNSSACEGVVPHPSTLPRGKYLLSEWLNIRSEFRVFVYEDAVLAVQNYQGSPLVFPDTGKLLHMVKAYRDDKHRPTAYTMDVAVICKKDQMADTVILSVCPFAASKLCGFKDKRIPDMLEAGIRYYL